MQVWSPRIYKNDSEDLHDSVPKVSEVVKGVKFEKMYEITISFSETQRHYFCV
jgi:hypothetical protein